MNLIDTIKGSMMEDFLPSGWNLQKIDDCVKNPQSVLERQSWWNKDFNPIPCHSLEEFDVKLGHEIAFEVKKAHDENRQIAFILPVGPMGMYKWVVYFLKSWDIPCQHVHGFNMDEWSDKHGNTLPPENEGSFQYAMENALYGPLGKLTVPENQRNYATSENLPTYPEKINELKKNDAKLVVVFGIGRVCHIAFWEPHFAAEYDSIDEWKSATHRLGAILHPLTIEQNAITSFKSRTTFVPAFANTIGPGLFLLADKIIGGCDGVLSRGMQWQGLSLWMTLRYGPDPWVPSSFMPTLSGKLFFLSELAGPLLPDVH